jgi:hypothetical protein
MKTKTLVQLWRQSGEDCRTSRSFVLNTCRGGWALLKKRNGPLQETDTAAGHRFVLIFIFMSRSKVPLREHFPGKAL